MELERMRRIIAEGMMGWHWQKHDAVLGWVDAWEGWTDEEGKRKISNWCPDKSWSQCGMVIERMRELGWDWHVSNFASGIVSVSLRHEKSKLRYGVEIAEHYGDECYARMLAAARALEGEHELL